MALQDYFNEDNLGPYHMFTGLIASDYRENHDANNTLTQTIIDDIDARIATLEDPTSNLIAQIGQAATLAAVDTRVSANDFFAISRVYDAKINGVAETAKKRYSKSLTSGLVTGDFFCSRWPGWMVNKELIHTTKDIHRAGIPIVFGTEDMPGAGLAVKAGPYTGEALFYQRLDLHVPIQRLRGNTYTLVIEYTTDIDDLFEVFVRYGPTGTPTTVTGNSNSFSADVNEILQTTLTFTVPDDADFVTVGLDFSGLAGDVYITSMRVEPGATATALGTAMSRTFKEDLELVHAHYWRRMAAKFYGQPTILVAGTTNDKIMHVTGQLGTPMPMPSSGSQAQFDTSLEVSATVGYGIEAGSLSTVVGTVEDFTAGLIDFTALAPFNAPVEQDRGAYFFGGAYTYIDSLIQTADIESNNSTVVGETPELFFAAELVTVHQPEL